MQQRRRQAAVEREVDALGERRLGARALRVAGGEQKLPALQALAAGLDPGPGALLVAGQGRDPDAGLGEAAASLSAINPALASARASAIGTSISWSRAEASSASIDSARILTDGALSNAANSRARKAGPDFAVFGSAWAASR